MKIVRSAEERARRAEAQRIRYHADPAKEKARIKKYKDANREEIRERNKEYHATHREERNAYKREWYRKNRESEIKKMKARRARLKKEARN